jgi:pilus assembly protein CpaE
MVSNVRVVVYADTPAAASVVVAALAAVETVSVQTRIGGADSVNILPSSEPNPDAVIVYLEENSGQALERLAQRPVAERPPLIVLGAGDDPTLVRLAMQAGARDILPLPVNRTELLAAISRVARAPVVETATTDGRIISFINAKGGSGATMLACNTAQAIARADQSDVCLIDLDLQFGDVPLYFDLQMQRDIVDALTEIDSLDATAFDAYLCRHATGVRVLGLSEERPVLVSHFGHAPVAKALKLARSMHRYVVVDLPRNIDEVTNLAVGMSSHVVLVVQQLVPALRDAKRMLTYLVREAGFERSRILIAVNRYDPRAEVRLADVIAAVGEEGVVCIPSDWALVSECINAGTTVYDRDSHSSVAQAVDSLQRQLRGVEEPAHRGLLARALTSIGLRAAK